MISLMVEQCSKKEQQKKMKAMSGSLHGGELGSTWGLTAIGVRAACCDYKEAGHREEGSHAKALGFGGGRAVMIVRRSWMAIVGK